jgi:hypothetical protein
MKLPEAENLEVSMHNCFMYLQYCREICMVADDKYPKQRSIPETIDTLNAPSIKLERDVEIKRLQIRQTKDNDENNL